MEVQRDVVIVGASLAGAKAAETLRSEGWDGRIVLVGEEVERPYERPPLSKEYLLGATGREKIYVHDADFYKSHEIDLRTGTRVVHVDPDARIVTTDTQDRIPYGKLLLTTGSSVRKPPIPGARQAGVLYLRSAGDSDVIREAASEFDRFAIVGAGWIGCEVAACLRRLGRETALIDMADLPLERVLGREAGGFYRDVHAAHGVEMYMGTGVEGIADDGHGQVTGVRLADGRFVEAQVVVVGVGVAPRVELAEAAGLATGNGILVDARLRSSRPDISAAGDVANAWHPVLGTRIRLEHWANALNQGPAAARNMLRDDAEYERVPYFYSDQYDVGMEYSGHALEWDHVVFRGDPASGEFMCFWLTADDVVLAGMNVNVWDVTPAVQAIVRSRRPVDVARLTDPGVELGAISVET